MDLREALLAVREERGELTPEGVVEEARDPDHPLHTRFEWDDRIAGHKYRLRQAGELLRVAFRPAPEAPAIRAFWPVRTGLEVSSYEPVEEVAQDPVNRAVMLRQMEREWRQFKARYEHMAEFVQMVREYGDTA